MTIETKEALLNGASCFIEAVPIEYIGFNKQTVNCLDKNMYQLNDIITIDNKEIGTIKSVKVVKVQDIDAIGIANIMKISIPIPRCIDGAKKAYDLLENKFKDWHNKQYNN